MTNAPATRRISSLGQNGRTFHDLVTDQPGSIDSPSVRELVEEVLEGGKDAFEMRRLKYLAHHLKRVCEMRKQLGA